MFYAGVKVDAQQSDALVRGKRECVDQVVIATIVVLCIRDKHQAPYGRVGGYRTDQCREGDR